MNYTEIETGYWFYVAGRIYVTTSLRSVHPILGNLWNVVNLNGEQTWLSESGIAFCNKA